MSSTFAIPGSSADATSLLSPRATGETPVSRVSPVLHSQTAKSSQVSPRKSLDPRNVSPGINTPSMQPHSPAAPGTTDISASSAGTSNEGTIREVTPCQTGGKSVATLSTIRSGFDHPCLLSTIDEEEEFAEDDIEEDEDDYDSDMAPSTYTDSLPPHLQKMAEIPGSAVDQAKPVLLGHDSFVLDASASSRYAEDEDAEEDEAATRIQHRVLSDSPEETAILAVQRATAPEPLNLMHMAYAPGDNETMGQDGNMQITDPQLKPDWRFKQEPAAEPDFTIRPSDVYKPPQRPYGQATSDGTDISNIDTESSAGASRMSTPTLQLSSRTLSISSTNSDTVHVGPSLAYLGSPQHTKLAQESADILESIMLGMFDEHDQTTTPGQEHSNGLSRDSTTSTPQPERQIDAYSASQHPNTDSCMDIFENYINRSPDFSQNLQLEENARTADLPILEPCSSKAQPAVRDAATESSSTILQEQSPLSKVVSRPVEGRSQLFSESSQLENDDIASSSHTDADVDADMTPHRGEFLSETVSGRRERMNSGLFNAIAEALPDTAEETTAAKQVADKDDMHETQTNEQLRVGENWYDDSGNAEGPDAPTFVEDVGSRRPAISAEESAPASPANEKEPCDPIMSSTVCPRDIGPDQASRSAALKHMSTGPSDSVGCADSV